MTREERLFTAIGGADEALLVRCRKPAKKWGGAWLPWAMTAAACLAVGMFLGAHLISGPAADSGEPPPGLVDVLSPEDPDGTENLPPPEEGAVPIQASGAGRFHAVKLTASVERPEITAPSFYLFVDEEKYTSRERDGVYVIVPKNAPDPSLNLPACEMTITHQEAITLEAAEAAALAALAAEYETVENAQDSPRLAGGRYLHAHTGLGWDAPVRDVTLLADGQGGVFTITASFFLEATEGHGARFANMAGTFRVVDGTMPRWLTDLQRTAEDLTRGILSNRLDLVEGLLTEDARIEGCGGDVLGDISVAGFDLTADDPANPTAAVVSVRLNRLEDSADFLTIELQYEDGKWLACWAGMEK